MSRRFSNTAFSQNCTHFEPRTPTRFNDALHVVGRLSSRQVKKKESLLKLALKRKTQSLKLALKRKTRSSIKHDILGTARDGEGKDVPVERFDSVAFDVRVAAVQMSRLSCTVLEAFCSLHFGERGFGAELEDG